MSKLNFQVLYFEATHFCNQSCKHCYLDCGGDKPIYEMNTEEVKSMIKRFKNQGGVFVTVTGGEPFARNDIFEILDYIEELGMKFLVASNGLLLTEERVKRLAAYKGLNSVHTSILGSCEEEHDYITNRKAYHQTLRAIELMHKYGVHSYIQITLSKKVMGKAMSIADRLSGYNCTMKFTPILDIGVKGDQKMYDELVVLEKDYGEFLEIHKKIKEKYGDKIDIHNLFNYEDIKAEVEEKSKDDLYGLKDAMLIVRPNGDKTFFFGLDNYISFGKVSEGIEIDVDERVAEYIEIKKKVDERILNEYKEGDFINYEFVSESMMAKR